MTSTLDHLVSPAGIVATVGRPDAARGLARLTGVGASAGGPRDDRTRGGGRSLRGPEHARLIAIAEAAERYAARVYGETAPAVTATARDLDGMVLDPARYPRCSAAERARPQCRVVPFDAGTPIRWVRGLELTSGEPIWVPAVQAAYRLHDVTPAERFTYRISTGWSVHTDPVEAVIGAVCEVVERDAIALTWLQRLPLPLIGAEVTSEDLRYLLRGAERHFVRTYLFDATTDLGVPTVYCLQVAEHDPVLRNVVGCATARDLVTAAEKALVDTMTITPYLHSATTPVPDSVDRIREIDDGARYMGLPERAHAFDFLVDGARDRPRRRREPLPADPRAALARLTAVFAERGMPVAVVDTTPEDLADAGLTSVSVVIPDLQPMSLHPYAQFLAHPRLYGAPARMGHRVLPEQELNTWPQPFA
ncbi:YcaO-like family protein [Actinoplanes sp. NPDC048796]|uniref:YcaO-like family protein n=1 Tax=unclassified Actinoplanes TaxID=2626549 RepID=UPI0034042C7D